MSKLTLAALAAALVPVLAAQSHAAPIAAGLTAPDTSIMERRGADDAKPRREDRRQDRTTVGR